MSLRRAAPLAFVVLLACQKSGPGASAPAGAKPETNADGDVGPARVLEGSLRIGPRPVMLAVYTRDPIPPARVADATARVRKKFPEAKVSAELDEKADLPSIVVMAAPLDKMAPPDERQLGYFGRGLDAAQIKAAAASKGVLAVTFLLDDDPKSARLRAAEALVLDLAIQQRGFVWDEITRELFTPQRWKEKRLDGWQGDVPDVMSHVTIHHYEVEAGRGRAITLGMAKFGLPDLVLNDAPVADGRAEGALLDTAAQSLVEGATVTHGELAIDIDALGHAGARAKLRSPKFVTASATRRGKVTLVPVHGEEGDPENRIVELRFPSYPGATEHEREAAAFASIAGAAVDGTVMESADDPELAAVRAKVQKRLPALQASFRKGLPPGQSLSVKAPFDSKDGKREWMWVGVTEWSGGVIRGQLDNDPEIVTTLRQGAKVEVKPVDVADYVLLDEKEGLKEGGGSIEILRRRHPDGP